MGTSSLRVSNPFMASNISEKSDLSKSKIIDGSSPYVQPVFNSQYSGGLGLHFR